MIYRRTVAMALILVLGGCGGDDPTPPPGGDAAPMSDAGGGTDASVQDGSRDRSGDAALVDGPGPDGPTSDGPTIDGPTSDAAASDGPASDGPTIDGPASDGPASDGPASDGPASDGPASDGPASDGPASDGPTPLGDGGAGVPFQLSCAKCPAGSKFVDVPGFDQPVCIPSTLPLAGCASPQTEPCKLAHASPTCGSDGLCAIASCATGWGDCDHKPENGCEVDLRTLSNCSTCGNACSPGQHCAATGCVPDCQPPLTVCDNRCVDLYTDPRGCGACNRDCGVGACTAGVCDSSSPVCPAGSAPNLLGCFWDPDVPSTCRQFETPFILECAKVAENPSHCGAAGTFCPRAKDGGAFCKDGHCEMACPPGRTLCDDKCVATAVDPANCGTCKHVCQYGAGEGCIRGQCVARDTQWLATGLVSSLNPDRELPVDGLAVDGTRLYYSDIVAGTIISRPKAGGAPTVLAMNQREPRVIVLDDTYVYWSARLGAAVMRVKKSGGDPELVTAATEPTALALIGDSIYFLAKSDATNYGLWKAPKAGGTATLIPDLPGLRKWHMVANSRFVAVSPMQLDLASLLIDTTKGDKSVRPQAAGWPVAMNAGYLFSDTGAVFSESLSDGTIKRLSGSRSEAYAVNECSLVLGNSRFRFLPVTAVKKLDAGLFDTGFPMLATVGLVLDDEYVYFRDTTAIGRVPIP
jgi:hypothetical protein